MPQLADDPNWKQAQKHHGEGRLEQAEAIYRQILLVSPQHVDALHMLGVLIAQRGNWRQGLDLIRRAILLRPQDAGAHFNLAAIAAEHGQTAAAEAAYREALRLKPGDADAMLNLAILLEGQGDFDEAARLLTQRLQLRPNDAPAHYNLGTLYFRRGDPALAVKHLEQAIQVDPKRHSAWSNLLYALEFHPEMDQRKIHEVQQRWHRTCAAELRDARLHANSRDPERRLRIGYVSPDFRSQAECFFVVPLLQSHDHAQFEVHCYSSVKKPDSITRKFRAFADHWHEVRDLSHEQLAEKIRADQIDILIDLTMHMAGGRLLAFARKPAPIQIAWLAYPGSTGLRAMDYRLTDAWMDPDPPVPSNDDSLFAEKSIRVPDCWCVYDPHAAGETVNVIDPARGTGPLTFGSLNNYLKINHQVLSLWAKLLKALPESRLVLLAPQGDCTDAVRRTFADAGVDLARVELLGRQSRLDYLKTYLRLDIALDPFPYNGITTTCDAFWMGCPVLTRVGNKPSARAGFSLLKNLGLDAFIAHTDEEFIAKARHWSENRGELAQLRATLRARLQASELMNAGSFARKIETIYRNVWREWCGGQMTKFE